MSRLSILILALSLLLLPGSLAGVSNEGIEAGQVAMIERVTDADISRAKPGSAKQAIREHYGNPDYFMKYIIRIPPVYV